MFSVSQTKSRFCEKLAAFCVDLSVRFHSGISPGLQAHSLEIVTCLIRGGISSLFIPRTNLVQIMVKWDSLPFVVPIGVGVTLLLSFQCSSFPEGLTMEFFLEQEEYLAELTESAGIRLSVHPQHIMPFPQDDSFLISPGQLTFVSLTLVYISVGSASDFEEIWILHKYSATLTLHFLMTYFPEWCPRAGGGKKKKRSKYCINVTHSTAQHHQIARSFSEQMLGFKARRFLEPQCVLWIVRRDVQFARTSRFVFIYTFFSSCNSSGKWHQKFLALSFFLESLGSSIFLLLIASGIRFSVRSRIQSTRAQDLQDFTISLRHNRFVTASVWKTLCMQACQKTCYQSHVVTECGCGDPTYPMQGSAITQSTDPTFTVAPCTTEKNSMYV